MRHGPLWLVGLTVDAFGCYNWMQTNPLLVVPSGHPGLSTWCKEYRQMAMAYTRLSAHTRPSLRARIEAAHSGLTTIPAGKSGIEPPATKSFTERYRDTEFATPADPTPARHKPAVADGRLFVLVSGCAVTSVLAVSLLSVLG